MDKKFLKENNLYESHKRFKKLYEYTFISNDLNEDDDDEMDNDGGIDDLMNMPDQKPQQATPNDKGDVNNTDNQDMDTSDPDAPTLGDTLDEPNSNDKIEPETETDSNDEEVIDVDDLTNSQEETESKVEDVDSKITQLIDLVNSFSEKINQNDAKIEDLKKEFQLRNPTEVEKLNLRSQDSMPFTVSPKDYWEDKSSNSNYKAEFDNSVAPNKEEMEYVIKNGDITNLNNMKSISDSIDDEDIDLDINKIFGF